MKAFRLFRALPCLVIVSAAAVPAVAELVLPEEVFRSSKEFLIPPSVSLPAW
jgi:hypothetical protein